MKHLKSLAGIIIVATLVMLPVSTIILTNYNNAKQYTIDSKSNCPIGYKPVIHSNFTVSNSTISNNTNMCGRVKVTLTIPNQTVVDTHLILEGYNASCLINCHGISYSYDPTAIMTNDGHDFMFNCKDFGTSSVITCESADFANMFLLSTATSLVVTDATCPATTIVTGGLYDSSAVTFTAGTAGSGTVTSTLAHTYTAAETDSSIAALCIQTENQAGSHIYSVYEFQIATISLFTGYTLAITASLTST